MMHRSENVAGKPRAGNPHARFERGPTQRIAEMRSGSDPWTINVLGHGLFGSELYLRGRTCHLPWYGSLAFVAAASALWEYGFEANGVRPSALDLVYRPVAGIALGEGRYLVWRAATRVASLALRQIVRAAVDPFGEAERAFGAGC